MSRIRKRLTYANVISTLALILVVGGGSAVAASQFAKESIPTRAIKKESIGPGKLTQAAKAALQGPKGATGATGPAGPAGPTGPAGAPGSAVAYAHVNADGSLDGANSKNVGATKLTPQTGYYCVSATVAVKNVVASGDGGTTARIFDAGFDDPVTSCPDGAAVVESYVLSGGTFSHANHDFYIVFN